MTTVKGEFGYFFVEIQKCHRGPDGHLRDLAGHNHFFVVIIRRLQRADLQKSDAIGISGGQFDDERGGSEN
jgi:hypothetical protein